MVSDVWWLVVEAGVGSGVAIQWHLKSAKKEEFRI